MALALALMAGCGSGGSDDRQPSADEIKAADANRQKVIDNLNVPEDQKAQMRAHMGGPGATNPADAAKAGAPPAGADGRRR